MGYRTVEVPESRVVILEGIYALNARLRPLLDLRVSITGGVHFDLVKRVLRDINRSGQAPEEIIQQVGRAGDILFWAAAYCKQHAGRSHGAQMAAASCQGAAGEREFRHLAPLPSNYLGLLNPHLLASMRTQP